MQKYTKSTSFSQMLIFSFERFLLLLLLLLLLFSLKYVIVWEITHVILLKKSAMNGLLHLMNMNAVHLGTGRRL